MDECVHSCFTSAVCYKCVAIYSIKELELRILIECPWASLIAQLVKNPPAMQETWV